MKTPSKMTDDQLKLWIDKTATSINNIAKSDAGPYDRYGEVRSRICDLVGRWEALVEEAETRNSFHDIMVGNTSPKFIHFPGGSVYI